MLPDFAGMIGSRLARVSDPQIADGISLHHRTDHVFHGCATFQQLIADGNAWLQDRGVARGGSRGASHVGIELLLDGELVGDSEVAELYLGALRAGATDALGTCIEWSDPEGRERWRAALARLIANGVPMGYRDPAWVARAVVRALSSRPRLALDSAAESAVAEWLLVARDAVSRAAPELLRAVRSGLAADPRGTDEAGPGPS